MGSPMNIEEAWAVSKMVAIDDACRLAAEKFKMAHALLMEGSDLLEPVAKHAINCETYEEAYAIYSKMPPSCERSELLVYLRGGA